MQRILLVLFLVIIGSAVKAAEDFFSFSTPQQEQQFMAITEELRCLVCQNQSLYDSNAPLALDLRQLIAEKIRMGQSDSQIRNDLLKRYGEFVFYKPAISFKTTLLWFSPLLLVLGATWILFKSIVRLSNIRLNKESKRVENDNIL